MGRVIDLITGWLRAVFDLFASVVSFAVSILTWPSRELGIPPEVVVVSIVCIAMIAIWWAMEDYWY